MGRDPALQRMARRLCHCRREGPWKWSCQETAALNVRFIVERTCDPKGCVDALPFPSLTMTLTVLVPAVSNNLKPR